MLGLIHPVRKVSGIILVVIEVSGLIHTVRKVSGLIKVAKKCLN